MILKTLKPAALVLLLLASFPLAAEHFFLKNGQIISGDVVKETRKGLVVSDTSGKKHRIAHTSIMRTLYGEFNRKKVYIYKTDGSVIQAFKVDEDANASFFRMDLDSPSEFSIPKSKIRTISNVSLAKKKTDTLAVQYGYYLPAGAMADNFKGNYIDLSLVYSTPYQFSSLRTVFSLSGGYTGLDISGSPLDSSTVFMIPLLASIRLPYPIFSLFSDADWTDHIMGYVSAGLGLQLVFLKDNTQNESARYMLLQPAVGFSFKAGLVHLYIQQNYNYLDVKLEPFTAFETVIGAGFYF